MLSSQPSSQPINQPSSQQSSIQNLPSWSQPSAMPSSQLSTQPSSQPLSQPSTQPSSQISSSQLSSQLSSQPSNQPSTMPQSQLSSQRRRTNGLFPPPLPPSQKDRQHHGVQIDIAMLLPQPLLVIAQMLPFLAKPILPIICPFRSKQPLHICLELPTLFFSPRELPPLGFHLLRAPRAAPPTSSPIQAHS